MCMHMSIKEHMKDLNTLKPEHQLLTIETKINELFNELKEFIKANPLKKPITKKPDLLKNLESIKITIKLALLTYNEPIYSSDEDDKESYNEEHKEYIEAFNIKSSDKEYIEPIDLCDKASFWMDFSKETMPLYDGVLLE